MWLANKFHSIVERKYREQFCDLPCINTDTHFAIAFDFAILQEIKNQQQLTEIWLFFLCDNNSG
jgi:hypothetical protein